jgi:LacI family transcriptional regulator
VFNSLHNSIVPCKADFTILSLNRIGKDTVTQQMIADAAGVHISTVSLALRNHSRLPAATRHRIQAVAEKLGYSPNPLISLLMARVRRRNASYRGTLAYVHTVAAGTPRLSGHVHRNFISGARRRAGELGYKLDEFFMDPAQGGQHIAAILRARNITGVVIEHMPSPACPDRRLPFDVGPFAASSLGVPLAHPQLHYVANDQYMRAVLASRELLALGYRRLGLIVHDTFDSAMAHRCSAGFWAVQEYIKGVAPIPPLRLAEGDVRGLRDWLRKHKPDAILASSEQTLPLLADLGWKIPADIGWVHLDWLPECRPAAGVYGNSDHTGAAAVELVVSQMHRGETGPPGHAMNYLVSGTWMPGKTIRQVGPPLDLDASFFADLTRG